MSKEKSRVMLSSRWSLTAKDLLAPTTFNYKEAAQYLNDTWTVMHQRAYGPECPDQPEVYKNMGKPKPGQNYMSSALWGQQGSSRPDILIKILNWRTA